MDKEYFFYREEQAVEQFPGLVKVLGYLGAYEEMTQVLSQDPLLHPEDVIDIAEQAAWEYFRGTD